MKHAILITAYKDFNALEQLVASFDSNFNIYIHIDKKSKVSDFTVQNILKYTNVKCVNRSYRVNWGGINHLKAYLLLSEKALKEAENQYFHLITGQDFPLQNTRFFNELLLYNGSNNFSYLDYFKMPSTEWENGGMNRLEQYNFYDFFNAKSFLGLKCIRFIQKMQTILKIKRPVNFKEQLYGGSTYWTLSRSALHYVIDFTQLNPQFLERFKHTFCAEEIYFQTVLLNSKHAQNSINDNLRCIDWESGKGGFPAFLDETDYDFIVSSKKLFARKITSSKLKELLTRYRNNQV